MQDVYIALVHHPVVNKEGKTVTTSVTNFDLHDLARTGCTYDVKNVFAVTPVADQRRMIEYLKEYWQSGAGATYNPTRQRAFSLVEHSDSLDAVCLTIRVASGIDPFLVATSAKKHDNSMGYSAARELRKRSERPWLLIFGTGYGLHSEVLQRADMILDPIVGPGDYNHLPVRGAVAIILDRLLGKEY